MRNWRGYDPKLDRFDVAVRGLVRSCHQQRRLREAIGLSEDEAKLTLAAEAQLSQPLKSEAGVFEMLQACPFLLDHALLNLVRYQARCQDGVV